MLSTYAARMFGYRLWMAAWVLSCATACTCESETPRSMSDAGHDAGMDAANDAAVDAVADAREPDEKDSGFEPSCAYDAALGEPETTPHEVFEEGQCPLQRIAADYVLYPTVECWRYPRCNCHRRARECRSSADCTAHPNGVCMGFAYDNRGIFYASCAYEQCTSDDDCESGQACACSERGPRICVRADCRSNDDCEPGRHCLRTSTACASEGFGDYLCTSDADECVVNNDCEKAGLGNVCARSGDHRECTATTTTCGD